VIGYRREEVHRGGGYRELAAVAEACHCPGKCHDPLGGEQESEDKCVSAGP
jgi:hypothetical protein